MKKPLKSGLMVVTAAVSMLAMSACGQQTDAAAGAGAETISVEHASGTTDVPVNPETVYTFDLGVLDSLTALGVEVDGVPEAVFPESLAQYGEDSYTKIGSMKEPDFEAISEGAPDLIIISGRTAEAYGELSKIAPTIDLSVDAAAPVESFKEVSTTLGEIFGKETEVEEKLSALDTKIEDTKAAAADAGTGLVLMTSGGEMTAYGAGSRFGIVHDVLGVQPAAEVKSEGPHGEAISHEFIAETNPDHLFVIDRDSAVGESGEAATAVLDNELVNGTKAAKNDSITYLDSASWYLVGYGLNNTDAMISAVQAAITK
ncbi:siderophore ABC transporter substrate-binding protein [Arthrobacter sulfonylureivorans]|uniref:Siderophore ABC transporter substrate-binding protein n=1 Tax=Arthrobacter sulfonylureivorans TaxID=2486855 RepID=A0ABY3WCF0_9MICC|nr:siderophore ABC transporter substrate-binding protein [Arthrobacter sulfonylureivorans]UNK46878.1 siderophore ABC transporter substrate-binding protein [Arthrobacter sulfonylureivorans]